MDRVIQGGPIDYSQLHLFLESSLFLCSRRSCEAPQRRRRVRADRARPVTARSPMIRPPDGAASVLAGLAKHPNAVGACGQTEREVSIALHAPTGILRNQETMQVILSTAGCGFLHFVLSQRNNHNRWNRGLLFFFSMLSTISCNPAAAPITLKEQSCHR